MKTIAFYAFKGGTGRTLALLHSAWALAREGRRVLVVDLDLGAPSFWSLLGDDAPSEGFVEVVADWLEERERPIQDYLREVSLDPQALGSLFVLHAGRVDRKYLETLQSLDWQRLLNGRPVHTNASQLPLFEKEDFFGQLQRRLREAVNPDVVFIDAPTGFSDTANVSLRVFADVVVVLFGPTRQQLDGVGRVVATLLEEQARRKEQGAAPRPEVYCVASVLMSRRTTGPLMKRVQDAFSFLERVRFEALGRPRMTEETAELVEQEPAIIAYDASLADLDRIELGVGPSEAQLAVYEDVLRFLRECVPVQIRKDSEPPVKPSLKQQALAEMSSVLEQFAEREPEKLEQYFLRVEHVDKLGDPMSVVVQGGKGSGKTALFLFATRKRHDGAAEHVAVHEAGRPRLGLDAFLGFERGNLRLETVWRAYALLQLDFAGAPLSPVVQSALDALAGLAARSHGLSEVLPMLSHPDLSVEVDRAWHSIDAWLGHNQRRVVLYFDGLDTIWGNNLDARDRGLRALLTAWQSTFARMNRIQVKIFLRTDLWEHLSFPEKSHLRGRTMTLVWRPRELWQLVLKRVLHAPAFVEICEARSLAMLSPETVEQTATEAAYAYLDVLFEQRIWTGKNSLSRNWILRRLEDAHRVIFPRDVLCLLQQAARLEEARLLDQVRTTPLAVLSRESLQGALVPTSKQRVDALREEYPELVGLLTGLNGLNAIGSLAELSAHIDGFTKELLVNPVEVLRKAGVLGVVGVEYKVPALYHYGLSMVRPGPT